MISPLPIIFKYKNMLVANPTLKEKALRFFITYFNKLTDPIIEYRAKLNQIENDYLLKEISRAFELQGPITKDYDDDFKWSKQKFEELKSIGKINTNNITLETFMKLSDIGYLNDDFANSLEDLKNNVEPPQEVYVEKQEEQVTQAVQVEEVKQQKKSNKRRKASKK